ncbi:MAG: HTH domain-containing protein [Actinobacteria bacterium]|nr:HTH domain-containing protein [Actinomycetota bacterium]
MFPNYHKIIIRELEANQIAWERQIFKRPKDLEEKLTKKTSGIYNELNVAKNVGKTERLESILEKIRNNVRFTIKSLSKEFSVNEKTIERDLELLKKQNKIIFIGGKRTGFWKMWKKL